MIKIYMVDGEEGKYREYLLSEFEEERLREKAGDWNWSPVEVLADGLERYGAGMIMPVKKELE